ncbi:MAG: hypothetical protein ACYCVH_04835 [Ignavibacteriaceae bacterium]
MKTLYLAFYFIVVSVLIFPQEIIKEKVSINPGKISQQILNIDITNPIYLRYGGKVTLSLENLLIGGYEFWEQTLGHLAGGTLPYDSLTLGTFPQWHKFTFYVYNPLTGQKYYNEITASEFIDDITEMCFYPSHHPGDPYPPKPEISWIMRVDADNSLAAMPPPEVLNYFGNPFIPSSPYIAPLNGRLYAMITKVNSNPADELWMDMPQRQLLQTNLAANLDVPMDLGSVSKGDSIRFFIRSSNTLVSSYDLYPNYYKDEQFIPNGPIFIGSLEFEDWTDELFDDLEVKLYFLPDPAEYSGPIAVTIQPVEISPGDTVELSFKRRYLDGTLEDFTPDQMFEVAILDGCMQGNFLVDGELGSYFNDIAQPVKFVAADSIGGDSAIVKIRVGMVRAVISSKIVTGSHHPVNVNKLSNVNKTKEEKIQFAKISQYISQRVVNNSKKAQGDYCYSGYFMSQNYSDVNLNVSQPEHDHAILLGETKYYYATVDNRKLTIHETKDPTSNPGLSNVTFDDPVAAQGSEKNPVYWEYKYPVYNGNIFIGMNTLPKGMIRLVGRYWEDGKIFKTALIAHYNGEASSINIEVKKPSKLGNSYQTVEDVFGHNINLDALIIKYAGEYGIPPQIIKGQIEHETSFKPAYRYEPWQDVDYQSSPSVKERYFGASNNFVVTTGGIGNGPGIPNNHTYVPPIGGYIISPTTIRNYLANNPSQYINTSKLVFFNDAVITSYWRMYFNELRNSNPNLGKQSLVTQSLKTTMNSFRDKLFGRMQYDWIAQTRIMASYGFLQLTHYNTTDLNLFGFTKASATQPPEFLNDESYNFPAYSERMIIKLKLKIGSSLPESNWTSGYEQTWLYVLMTYNPEEKNYGNNVLTNSQKYLPLTGD